MKVMILNSSKSRGSATRICQIVGKEIDCEFSDKWPKRPADYDGFILHNRIDIRPDVPCAIYVCGSLMGSLLKSASTRRDLEKKAPRVFWTNSYTMTEQLRKWLSAESSVKYMPKPLLISIPNAPPSVPVIGSEAARTILWYWYPNWSYFEGITPDIVSAMNQLSDFRIFVIHGSNKDFLKLPPGVGSHVTMLGKTDLRPWRDKFSGMVRVATGLDFGRSIYQMRAYGKWTICWDMKELHTNYVKQISDVPEMVRTLTSGTWSSARAQLVWEYMKDNFTEDKLKKLWSNEIKRVFE